MPLSGHSPRLPFRRGAVGAEGAERLDGTGMRKNSDLYPRVDPNPKAAGGLVREGKAALLYLLFHRRSGD